MGRHYELLEHTADVGIRATGDTLEEAFGAAAEALAELLGAWFPGEGEERTVVIEAADREALLVSWLDELLYVHEAEDAVFGGFAPRRLDARRLDAGVRVASRAGRRLEGEGVKAATYHRLSITERAGSIEAVVYLDV